MSPSRHAGRAFGSGRRECEPCKWDIPTRRRRIRPRAIAERSRNRAVKDRQGPLHRPHTTMDWPDHPAIHYCPRPISHCPASIHEWQRPEHDWQRPIHQWNGAEHLCPPAIHLCPRPKLCRQRHSATPATLRNASSERDTLAHRPNPKHVYLLAPAHDRRRPCALAFLP
jgi:hypothetical protein